MNLILHYELQNEIIEHCYPWGFSLSQIDKPNTEFEQVRTVYEMVGD